MITITEKVRVIAPNQKVEFELENLPEDEYSLKLSVDDEREIASNKDYSLENWSSGIKLDPLPTFRREDMYGHNGR